MTDIDRRRLGRRFDRLQRQLPGFAGGTLQGLRTPAMRWVRIPMGTLLVIGGVFSFLPVLGIWMLPLGVMLLAHDVPPLRRPTNRMLIWGERRLTAWRRRRRRGS